MWASGINTKGKMTYEERMRLFRERNEARKRANNDTLDALIDQMTVKEDADRKRWSEHWAGLPIQKNIALEEGR